MIRVLMAAVAASIAFSPGSGAGEAVIRFDVEPMAEAKPAFKNRLLPELRELNAGNAAQDYLKRFMEQRTFFFSKQAIADRARYQAMPLAELAGAEIEPDGGLALRQADWAARLDNVDWQTLERVQEGGIAVLPA